MEILNLGYGLTNIMNPAPEGDAPPMQRYFNELSIATQGSYDLESDDLMQAQSYRISIEYVFRGGNLVLFGRGGNLTSTALINADGSFFWGFDNNLANNVTLPAGTATDDDTIHTAELIRQVIASDSQLTINIDGVEVLSQLFVNSTSNVSIRYVGKGGSPVQFSDGILCCFDWRNLGDFGDDSTFVLGQAQNTSNADLQNNRTILSSNAYDHRLYTFDTANGWWDDGMGNILFIAA